MALPGVVVTVRDAPPSRGAPTDTAVWFVSGLADSGPTDRAVRIRSLTEFTRTFGSRVSYSPLYDALDVFFREGGASAYVARVVGPAAAKATVTLDDASNADSIAVTAKDPGLAGNNLRVAVLAGTGSAFILVVSSSTGVELERSPELADKAAAVGWSSLSSYVNVTSLAGAAPAPVAATALATGTDDRAGITDAHYVTSLSHFEKLLGPGQVSVPGVTSTAVHSGLLAHARDNNRFALVDAPNTDVVATVAASATAVRAAGNADYGAFFAPWVVVPGVVAGTTRTVPYSAVEAGLIARNDAVYTPGQPVAGRRYPLQYVTRLAANWNDSQREQLLHAGINTAKNVFGSLRTYGFRTVANKDTVPNWWQAGHSRLRMAIVAQAENIGESFLFEQGTRSTASEFGAALEGMLLRFYNQRSLFGETPAEAFRVEIGPSVNTPERNENGELWAEAAVRMAPGAELVNITFVKVPITQSVA